jgi:hypothetical protein
VAKQFELPRVSSRDPRERLAQIRYYIQTKEPIGAVIETDCLTHQYHAISQIYYCKGDDTWFAGRPPKKVKCINLVAYMAELEREAAAKPSKRSR